jgi:Leucine-rich repeat (LRR) protein
MALKDLNCYGTGIVDLAPVRALPKLRVLGIGHTPITSLAPLRGLRLTTLTLIDGKVEDLSPLQGMPLEVFSCAGSRVGDLEPLRNMKTLKTVNLASPWVKTLEPLRGLPIEELEVGNKVTDLAPLRGMPLRWLLLPSPTAAANRAVLQAIPTLKQINYQPPEKFWKDFDAKQLKEG